MNHHEAIVDGVKMYIILRAKTVPKKGKKLMFRLPNQSILWKKGMVKSVDDGLVVEEIL